MIEVKKEGIILYKTRLEFENGTNKSYINLIIK